MPSEQDLNESRREPSTIDPIAARQVLPDLLNEVDALEPRERILALAEGVLAGNIFDWGSRACVELYQVPSQCPPLSAHLSVFLRRILCYPSSGVAEIRNGPSETQNGTILEIYRQARSALNRPWGIDDFDSFAAKLLATGEDGEFIHRYRRALLFCDNSGCARLSPSVP